MVLYAIEVVVYMLFGSGEEQKWNKIDGEPGEAQPLKSPKEENNKGNKSDVVNAA